MNETYSDKDVQRFWSKVDVRGPDDCWLWKGNIATQTGYGDFRFNRKLMSAHRFMYLLTHGSFQGVVRHTCDVRACVNPAHLLLGTHKENREDCARRGRTSNGQAKLTEGQAREVIARRNAGAKLAELAAEYGVCIASISMLANRRTWPNLDRERVDLPQDALGRLAEIQSAKPRTLAAKLMEEQVLEIRSKRTAGYSVAALAREYDVTPPLISAICLRKVWKHI